MRSRISSLIVIGAFTFSSWSSFAELYPLNRTGASYDSETGIVWFGQGESAIKAKGGLMPKGLSAYNMHAVNYSNPAGDPTGVGEYLVINADYTIYVYKQNKNGEWSFFRQLEDGYAKRNGFMIWRLKVEIDEKLGVIGVRSVGADNSWSGTWVTSAEPLPEDPNFQKLMSRYMQERYRRFQAADTFNDLRTDFSYEHPELYEKIQLRLQKQSELKTARKDGAPQAPVHFEGRFPEIPTIAVKSEDGKGEANAWELVESFSKDLLADYDIPNYQPDPELRQIEDQILINLLKVEGGSVKLLAPPGVGKSVLIKRLMYRIARGDVPEPLLKYRFRGFSAAALEAGSKYVGTIEARMTALSEVAKRVPVIFIVDEAHALASVGVAEGRPNNAMQMIKDVLATGELKTVMISTPDEWPILVATDPAADRRFSKVEIREPSGPKLVRMAKSWMVEKGLPELPDALIKKAIQYSSEFGVEGVQPSKVTKLLAQFFADAQFHGRMDNLSIGHLKQSAQKLYGIDPAEFEPARMRKRLQELEQGLEQLAEQDEAKRAILDTAEQVFTGVADKTKPRFRLVFAGPKGQGKTEIVQLFTKAMELPEDNRIVMSEFTSPHQVDDMKGQIASFLRRHATPVLFFDEFEKAHPVVQKALLGILDSGSMTVNTKVGNRRVTTTMKVSNAYVFMSTNAGVNYIDTLVPTKKEGLGFGRDSEIEVPEFNMNAFKAAMIHDGFDEYVLDRMDKVVVFTYPTYKQFEQTLKIHLARIVKGIAENTGVKISIASQDRMAEEFAKSLYRPRVSNREVLRILSEKIRQPIAKRLVQGKAKSLTISLESGQVKVSTGIKLMCSKVY